MVQVTADPAEAFRDEPPGAPAVRGFLHRPAASSGNALVLTHGAGSDASAPLLVALGHAFAARGVLVLRCDLPYRQARPKGPPSPSGASRDREGLRRAVQALRRMAAGHVWLGGSSYGGRQASMLLAESPEAADALLLLSYPLHPPGRPAEGRTAHLGQLRVPTFFAHGALDPFGSIAAVDAARALIPGRTALLALEGTGHGLGPVSGGRRPLRRTVDEVVDGFLDFAGAARRAAR